MFNPLLQEDCGHLRIDPTRPVCFLDIDGVLNGALMIEWPWYREVSEPMAFTRGDWVDGQKSGQFFELMRLHRVQVVIVSSWVSCYETYTSPTIGALRGFFKYKDILGSLHTGGGFERGRSVSDCVRHHGLTRWFVVDDAGRRMYESHVVPERHLFVPHGRYGLTDEMLESIHLFIAPEEGVKRPRLTTQGNDGLVT